MSISSSKRALFSPVSFVASLLWMLCYGPCLTGTAHAQATTTNPVSLGTFSILSESAPAGNSVTMAYGVSREGNILITYWLSNDILQVLSVGGGQYEITEALGNRCLTASGPAVAITTCSAASTQLFGLSQQSDGSFAIQSGDSLCVTVGGAFATLDAEACDASAGQSWQFSGSTPLVLPVATPTPTPTPTPQHLPQHRPRRLPQHRPLIRLPHRRRLPPQLRHPHLPRSLTLRPCPRATT